MRRPMAVRSTGMCTCAMYFNLHSKVHAVFIRSSCAFHAFACVQATNTRDYFLSNPVFRDQDPDAPCVPHETGGAYFCMATWRPLPSGERAQWLVIATVVTWLGGWRLFLCALCGLFHSLGLVHG